MYVLEGWYNAVLEGRVPGCWEQSYYAGRIYARAHKKRPDSEGLSGLPNLRRMGKKYPRLLN
jgi:hypothetical protein